MNPKTSEIKIKCELYGLQSAFVFKLKHLSALQAKTNS